VELEYSGKVRDMYADGDDLIMVASDRVSVYDVVLPTPIPDKGRVLTQLSLWWFWQLSDVIANHVIVGGEIPAQWAGRAIRCRRLQMLPVECIARGYLAGLGLESYRQSGTISGVALPPGLEEGSRLPEPVFTPTTKAATGHDEPMTRAQLTDLVGAPAAAALEQVTLEIYQRGAELAAARGVVIADTKLEFGMAADGALVLADEVLTPDSSRFWPASEWAPGRPQHSLDKQFLRDWSAGLDWNRQPPGPAIPPEVVAATRERYLELYRTLTGSELAGGVQA
jgi:phosphoribosylaminoimidazole-succinocarboxamide synthase